MPLIPRSVQPTLMAQTNSEALKWTVQAFGSVPFASKHLVEGIAPQKEV